MATSSITHNFVVTDAKRFLDAIDESERKCAEIDKPKEPLGIDLEEFVGEMLRGTF